MRVEVIPAQQLTADLCERWIQIQRSEPMFHSPFVRPEFTQAVAAVRSDVEVAILEHGGRVAGFFPFQRSRSNWGRPVGTRVSDLQAVIATPGTPWNALELVRACRLKAWDFHQFHAGQREIMPYATQFEDVVYLDLSGGYEAYAEERQRTNSQRLKSVQKTIRQAEKRVGRVRYEPQTTDSAAFDALLTWKADQYRRTGGVNVFAFDWVVALLRKLLEQPSRDFGGMLSALYIGERLAAVDLALRSHEIRCEWFGTYAGDLARYSPGILALVALARTSFSLGIERVELGKNNMPYKASFASATYPVAIGTVAVGAAAKLFGAGKQGLVQLARCPYLAAPARVAKRLVRTRDGRQAFE